MTDNPFNVVMTDSQDDIRWAEQQLGCLKALKQCNADYSAGLKRVTKKYFTDSKLLGYPDGTFAASVKAFLSAVEQKADSFTEFNSSLDATMILIQNAIKERNTERQQFLDEINSATSGVKNSKAALLSSYRDYINKSKAYDDSIHAFQKGQQNPKTKPSQLSKLELKVNKQLEVYRLSTKSYQEQLINTNQLVFESINTIYPTILLKFEKFKKTGLLQYSVILNKLAETFDKLRKRFKSITTEFYEPTKLININEVIQDFIKRHKVTDFDKPEPEKFSVYFTTTAEFEPYEPLPLEPFDWTTFNPENIDTDAAVKPKERVREKKSRRDLLRRKQDRNSGVPLEETESPPPERKADQKRKSTISSKDHHHHHHKTSTKKGRSGSALALPIKHGRSGSFDESESAPAESSLPMQSPRHSINFGSALPVSFGLEKEKNLSGVPIGVETQPQTSVTPPPERKSEQHPLSVSDDYSDATIRLPKRVGSSTDAGPHGMGIALGKSNEEPTPVTGIPIGLEKQEPPPEHKLEQTPLSVSDDYSDATIRLPKRMGSSTDAAPQGMGLDLSMSGGDVGAPSGINFGKLSTDSAGSDYGATIRLPGGPSEPSANDAPTIKFPGTSYGSSFGQELVQSNTANTQTPTSTIKLPSNTPVTGTPVACSNDTATIRLEPCAMDATIRLTEEVVKPRDEDTIRLTPSSVQTHVQPTAQPNAFAAQQNTQYAAQQNTMRMWQQAMQNPEYMQMLAQHHPQQYQQMMQYMYMMQQQSLGQMQQVTPTPPTTSQSPTGSPSVPRGSSPSEVVRKRKMTKQQLADQLSSSAMHDGTIQHLTDADLKSAISDISGLTLSLTEEEKIKLRQQYGNVDL